ncbi:MAG: hypothetical protein K8823_815 [Cenarchaeum symbiont of Oopsacas minuta]|nr:hypothetical protein [Cenarchaeum symbiont of Oopsacas minuta]
MAIEKYIAAAGLGLYIIFVMEIITLYHFMQTPPEDLFKFILEPEPKILQFISIGIAPASIMAAVSFIMTRRYGSKLVGSMIVIGGSTLLAGMIYTTIVLLGGVQEDYLTIPVKILPPLLIIVSIPTIIVGTSLFKNKVRRIKKGYL